ncbi:MAG: MarR family transcriptional regulator [Candidatus Nanohaloarchaea archaeon]|nr:MarR family transcriptional regulator [Candidatus Nanohaloarchaea archaeon]
MALAGRTSSPAESATTVVARVSILLVLVASLASLSAATEIGSVREVIDIGEQTEVSIHLNYTELTAEQVSVLIPSSHDPNRLSGHDTEGRISCQFNARDNEILCEPGRYNTTYNVTITYTTPNEMLSKGEDYYTFSHVQRILVPTDQYVLRVLLPEGYGLVNGNQVQPFSPAGAATGSAEGGRRFSVTWRKDNLSLGESLRFEIRYQELRVFEDIFPDQFSVLAALVLIILSLVLYLYVKRRRKEGETIASIMPVLKDDEREVLRYLIEQDGDCEQKELVDNLDYSKAKISRLVKDLEERSLLKKVKEGRKNRLLLTREVGDVDMDED